MKHLITALLCGSMAFFSTSCRESLEEVVDRGLDVAGRQSVLLAQELELQQDRLPRTFEDGEVKSTTYRGWVSGFFPGTLWYLYEHSPSEELRRYADLYTLRVEPAKDLTSTHDLGFMLYCSFGNGYRLTENPYYMEVLERGAASLATRYNDTVRALQSWNSNSNWQYPVIIDNMMNLEFLSFVSKKTNNERYLEIANRHARKTLENHFRPDNSCFHVVSYDTINGLPHFKGTHQGYSNESVWARGQAWALYGYTMMYRETGLTDYLEQARKVAAFIEKHPNLPEDKIPYWDFDAPDIPNCLRDASAGAIMASALIELSQLDTSPEAAAWLKLAKQQIRSLSSPEYLSEVGANGGFILKHSVGNHNKNSEMDVPLSYADYYYVEALLRLKKVLK